MSYSQIKSSLLLNLKNLPGRRTTRKIVVIECDDWGGIRMPSKRTYDILLNAGISVNQSRFMRYDTLADKNDLEYLFNILLEARDKHGNPAVVTPVTNVANPDFEKIKESGFTHYFFEPFNETLKRYGRDPETFNTWKKGIALGIFTPEFHGREHISVNFWLKKLRDGYQHLRTAFEHEVVAVQVGGLPKWLSEFRPEFYFNSQEQIGFLNSSIIEGVNLFRDIFGYTPLALTPSNGIFHPILEKTVADSGLKYLNMNHFNPIPDKNGKLKLKYFHTGKKTNLGLTYYTRNCAFEPTDPGYSGIDLTMKQIEAAFRWGKPANVSTHRVNFIGAIEPTNREKGLKELKLLLTSIVKKWPDVEFMSSADMFKAIAPND